MNKIYRNREKLLADKVSPSYIIGLMSKLKIKLNRNLRRTILRGHPWVYKGAFEKAPPVAKAELARILDQRGEDLAWAIYDPHSALALRILSLEKAPPTKATYEKRLAKAWGLRQALRSEETTAFRFLNGEGDELPGLVCDIYGSVAVLQFDGKGPGEFWDAKWLSEWILKNTTCKTVVEKSRRSDSDRGIVLLGGEACESEVILKENGVLFKANIEKGQKTGFFLDQRDNRQHVRQISRGLSVLNLFSYTGGFSIYAGLGGASRVASLDLSRGATELATENWALNGLEPAKHQSMCLDVFDYLQGQKEFWDCIIVDPPSMSHDEEGKAIAIAKYTELFAAAAKRVNPGGHLILSSCSSHISFADFFEITNEALSAARRRGQTLRISGQGLDHPFPQASYEMRYLKFVHLVLD